MGQSLYDRRCASRARDMPGVAWGTAAAFAVARQALAAALALAAAAAAAGAAMRLWVPEASPVQWQATTFNHFALSSRSCCIVRMTNSWDANFNHHERTSLNYGNTQRR